MQCSYNVIAYKDKPRLRTALEMLRTTREIESRLEEVCGFNLLCSDWFCFYKRHLSLVQLLRSLLILTSIALLNSFVQTLNELSCFWLNELSVKKKTTPFSRKPFVCHFCLYM